MPEQPGLARRLTLFDATMIVMGGIVGAGIFMNPAVVAQEVTSSAAILGAWLAGGAVALAGAFIYAELASRRPAVGGQYAYLREAFHPMVAFLYGWTLLLVVQSGGMAAVAMTFARYFRETTAIPASDGAIAACTLMALTAVNCLGVRAGSNLQSTFMVLKIGAVLMLVACGWYAVPLAGLRDAGAAAGGPGVTVGGFGGALVPVLFAYGGWQTASFMAGELRSPRRDLPLGLLIGVAGVVALYLSVNLVCLRVLGPAGLAGTKTPATDVMRAALGDTGALVIAAGIAISTVGFLSQSLLTAPRVYFAMAADGLFFRSVARVDRRTQAPTVAIVLQGVLATVIALSGSYERVLGYVVSMDWVFFGLTGAALLVLRRRDARAGADETGVFHVPARQVPTVAFIAVACFIVVNTIDRYPANTLIGFVLLAAGVPVYFLWRRNAPEGS